MRYSPPPPSKSLKRVIQYLEIVETATNEKGFANHYDIFKGKAMNSAYASYVIRYLKDSGFIQGDEKTGYVLSQVGKDLLYISRRHSPLLGILTQELSGDNIRRYS